MEKKELYQVPSIEEINSLLDCAAVRGIGEGSGMLNPDPDDNTGEL